MKMLYERNMYLLTKMFLLNQNVLSLSITKMLLVYLSIYQDSL